MEDDAVEEDEAEVKEAGAAKNGRGASLLCRGDGWRDDGAALWRWRLGEWKQDVTLLWSARRKTGRRRWLPLLVEASTFFPMTASSASGGIRFKSIEVRLLFNILLQDCLAQIF